MDYKRSTSAGTKVDPTTPKRLKRFGLTVEAHQDLLKRQKYTCGICPRPVDEKSPIDHCHETGKVRGVLCYKCNNGLGAFHDKLELVRSAHDWLELGGSVWSPAS